MKRSNLLVLYTLFMMLLLSCTKENIQLPDKATSTTELEQKKILKCSNINDVQKTLRSLILKDSTVSAILCGTIDKTGSLHFASEGDIKPEDLMYTASPGSKGVTTFMILKERIDIDQTIDKWLPLSKGYTKSDKITLRMLLSHTSGIPDYVLTLKPDTLISTLGIIDYGYKNSSLLYPPGKYWCYSNTNFIIAGYILEKVTGKTFNQLLKKHFGKIAPSLFIMDSKPFSVAKAYMPMPFNPSVPKFAGGLVGSAIDVLKAFNYIYSQPEYTKMAQFTPTKKWSDVDTNPNDYFYAWYIYAYIYGLGTAKYTFNNIGTFTGADGDIGVGLPQLFNRDGKTYLINTVVSQFHDWIPSIKLKQEHANAILDIIAH